MGFDKSIFRSLASDLTCAPEARDSYEKQIRTDTSFFIIPIFSSFTLLACLLMWFGAEPPFYLFLPVTIAVSSVVISRICWQILRTGGVFAVELAGLIFCISHSLFVGLAFWDLWPAAELIPYFFALIVLIASHIIYPQAGFYIWYLSCGLLVAGLYAQGSLNSESVLELVPAVILGGVTAVLGYFLMQDWVTAVLAASRSHLLASRQRDQLYELTEELEKARDRQIGLYAELNTISDIGRQIVSELDLDQLLSQMAHTMHDQLKYAYIAIFLYDPAKNHLLLQAQQESKHLRSREMTIYPLALNAPHIISQAAQRKVLLQTQRLEDEEFPSHPYQRSYTFTEVAIPLLVGENLLGVLNIQSTTARPFASDSLQNMQVLADQAAIAVYNATLYKEISLSRDLMAKLNTISRAISGTLQVDLVFDLILNNLIELIEMSRVSILLLEGNGLRVVAHHGFPASSNPMEINVRLQTHGDAFNAIRNTLRPLAIDDVTQFSTWQQLAGLTQTRSWLGAPLIKNETVIGMLSLSRTVLQPFTTEEIELTSAFAAQASVALDNAQTFSAMTQARSEAERANKLKGQFISNMSHEFKTPLNGIINMTGFVLDGVMGDVNQEQSKALQQTVDNGHHLLSMVNDILDITKFEAGMLKIPFTPVNVMTIFDAIYEIAQGLVLDRSLEIRANRPDEAPIVRGSRRRIRQILLNLVSNAIKYTPSGYVDMDMSILEDGYVQISVSDTGIGIPQEDQDFVFESFAQAQNNIDNPLSTGLGLPITKHLVDLHRGRIWFESTVDVGSTFYVCLPLDHDE